MIFLGVLLCLHDVFSFFELVKDLVALGSNNFSWATIFLLGFGNKDLLCFLSFEFFQYGFDIV